VQGCARVPARSRCPRIRIARRLRKKISKNPKKAVDSRNLSGNLSLPLIGDRVNRFALFPKAPASRKAKTFTTAQLAEHRVKIFEILTLKANQRVTAKIDLWVIVSSFFMRHKIDRKVTVGAS
jgi:hypothetical protein